MKAFTRWSKIVANRRNGNVCSWEAHVNVGLKKHDPVNEKEIGPSDIILLQDPNNIYPEKKEKEKHPVQVSVASKSHKPKNAQSIPKVKVSKELPSAFDYYK